MTYHPADVSLKTRLSLSGKKFPHPVAQTTVQTMEVVIASQIVPMALRVAACATAACVVEAHKEAAHTAEVHQTDMRDHIKEVKLYENH